MRYSCSLAQGSVQVTFKLQLSFPLLTSVLTQVRNLFVCGRCYTVHTRWFVRGRGVHLVPLQFYLEAVCRRKSVNCCPNFLSFFVLVHSHQFCKRIQRVLSGIQIRKHPHQTCQLRCHHVPRHRNALVRHSRSRRMPSGSLFTEPATRVFIQRKHCWTTDGLCRSSNP